MRIYYLQPFTILSFSTNGFYYGICLFFNLFMLNG